MRQSIEDHYIQNDTVFSIGEFSILWGMFEEKYFEMNCKREKIMRLKVNLVNETLINLAKEIKDELLIHYTNPEKAIKHLRVCKKDKLFYNIICSFLENREMNDNDIILASICICYRVRNNMFHGEKSFFLLNGQKGIIDSCSAFLNDLLEVEEILEPSL